MDSLSVVRGWFAYLQASGFADHSIENYARPVTRLLMEVDFRAATLDDLVAFSLTQPKRSAHITFSALRSFFSYAVQVNALEVDPTGGLRSPAQPLTVPKALTPDELDCIRVAAYARDPRRGATIDLLAHTGARTAEAVAIEPADVVDGAVVLRKVKARPGGLRAERMVPLSPTGERAVEQLLELPPSRYAPPLGTLIGAGKKSVYQWVKDAAEEVGIDTHPHVLRATYATRLAELGVDARTVQELLGHTNLTTTQRYIAVTDERKRAAVALLG
jgi:integrase/recombinase XerC